VSLHLKWAQIKDIHPSPCNLRPNLIEYGVITESLKLGPCLLDGGYCNTVTALSMDVGEQNSSDKATFMSNTAKSSKSGVKKKVKKTSKISKSETPADKDSRESSEAGIVTSSKSKVVNQKMQTLTKKVEKKVGVISKSSEKTVDKVVDKITEKMVSGKKSQEAVKVSPNRPLDTTVAAKQFPIKVEPKIIETQDIVFRGRNADEQLFSKDELESFRELLINERSKILVKAKRAMEDGNIQIDKNEMFDEVDQAAAMIDQNLTFRLLDRDRKLLQEIDHALAKIDTGDYGYCEGTGEPIPKRRLELRPWCRHSVKYKERLERMKKSGRGVVDEDEI